MLWIIYKKTGGDHSFLRIQRYDKLYFCLKRLCMDFNECTLQCANIMVGKISKQDSITTCWCFVEMLRKSLSFENCKLSSVS